MSSKIIDRNLADRMDDMIGFRNTVVHQYQKINFDIVVAVLQKDADDLLEFGELIIRQSERLNMLNKISDIEFDDEKKTEEQLVHLIEQFFDFYKNNKATSSDLINVWRRCKIEDAISAISGKGAPKMFRLCAISLKLFLESEDHISRDVLRSSFKTEKEEDIEHDITILKKQTQ